MQGTAQQFAFAKHGAGAGVDNVWEQRKLEVKFLSKYDQYTLNPFPNFSVVFGGGAEGGGGQGKSQPSGNQRIWQPRVPKRDDMRRTHYLHFLR
jgi:hypothetical protein